MGMDDKIDISSQEDCQIQSLCLEGNTCVIGINSVQRLLVVSSDRLRNNVPRQDLEE
jgi:hypothetical protein